MSNDSDLVQPIAWPSPWNYPTRVDVALAINIATAIAYGSSLKAACMLYDVAPSRAHNWLVWGEAAYRRDADGSDSHADYLDFFLKVMHGIGVAAVSVQQQTRLEGPAWWLQHNPEQRGDWGAPAMIGSGSVIPGSDVTEEVSAGTAVDVPSFPVPDHETVRGILRTLINIGAAIDVERDSEQTG
jgi:hypothetical protein